MARTVFRQEDRKRLKIIAEEVPKIRSLMEELLETVDILGNSEELDAIRESLAQIKRGETRSWDEYVEKAGIEEGSSSNPVKLGCWM